MDDAAKRKCEEFLQRFDPDALYEGKTLSWLDEMRNNLRRIKGLAEWAPDDYDFVFKIYRHVAFFDEQLPGPSTEDTYTDAEQRPLKKRLKAELPVPTPEVVCDLAEWFEHREVNGPDCVLSRPPQSVQGYLEDCVKFGEASFSNSDSDSDSSDYPNSSLRWTIRRRKRERERVGA